MIEGFGGFDVIGHAKNGAEAVKLFKTLEPDVVLMDIVMPMMDGIQSLRTLMRLDPNARVVVVSSVMVLAIDFLLTLSMYGEFN